LLGQLLYRFFHRPLDPPTTESAGDDHGRAKPNKAATRRGCGSSADDGWSSLRESKEEEVPRDILRRTSASVATIEFDPGLDRLVDPFDKVHEEFYALHARDFDRSVEEAEAAIEIAPNDAIVRSGLSTFLSAAGKIDRPIEWGSEALRQEHSAAFQRFLKPNLAWDLYLAGRNDDALENMKGNEMVEPDVAAAINIRLGRVEEARSLIADWLKTGSFSIATELCWAIKEPMKSANLDDLRKAGLPEK
jgi:tetratricopeptide (TPR) repeat protein